MNVWDVRQRQSRKLFFDDGCIIGTSIACSPNGRYLACGSNTGIVNLYDNREVEAMRNPVPVKIFDGLRTRVDCIQFNHSSEALVMSSKELKQAVKIVSIYCSDNV